MKRSKMVTKLEIFLVNNGICSDEDQKHLNNVANCILYDLQANGMMPPPVPAQSIRGKDYPWGAGCTMRCDCDDCNPNFPINKWEPEDDSK